MVCVPSTVLATAYGKATCCVERPPGGIRGRVSRPMVIPIRHWLSSNWHFIVGGDFALRGQRGPNSG